MAYTWILQKDAVQEDVTAFTITDLTVYGGANPARNLRAHYFFSTKTDKDGNRTLLTITPDSNDPLAVSSWYVTGLTLDGLVEKILFSIKLFGIGDTYNIDDVFYNVSDTKLYKCKQNGTVGHTAPNTTYFDEITADSLYTDEILNDSTYMEIVDQFDLIMGRNEAIVSDQWEDVTDVFLNGKYNFEYTKADYLDSMINGAEAAMLNSRPYEAEEIVRGIENYLLTY